MKVKLLSTGLQRNGLKIDRKILEEVIRNFKQPVPITLGHPRSDTVPAVGFFEKVELKDDSLYGKYSLSPLGQILLSSNNYRNISVGLRKKPDGSWYLHHVALLGAIPPGAEDAEPLRVVNLSNEEGEDFHFDIELANDKKYVSYAKTDYPVCLECEWDKESAMKRIVERYGWEKLSQCVGAVEIEEDGKLPESYSKYRFPFCDVVDGEVRIIAKAVSSGLAFLSGAMGADVDPRLAQVVKPVFERLRQKIEKEKSKNMSNPQGGDKAMKELQEKLSALEKRLAKEKVERLRDIAQKKFSDEVVKEIVDFASSLPMDFSQEETYIDRLIRLVEKMPAPVSEGRKEFSLSEGKELNFSDAVKAF